MDWLPTVVLSLVQGLTEFLPVSSSGHLRLFADWFGMSEPQTLFDAVLHGGTLGAVLVIYRAPLAAMVRGLFSIGQQRQRDESEQGEAIATRAHARLAGLVVIGSVPTAAIGLIVGPWLEAHLSSAMAVGCLLLLNGAILQSTRSLGEATGQRGLEALHWRDALVIGTVQGAAVLRGISRSGSTIACGLWLGLQRDVAAMFSFLLSIPAVGGGLLLLVLKAANTGEPVAWGAFTACAGLAFLSGLWALRWLVRLVNSGSFYRFAPYCWALGVAAIAIDLLRSGH